MITFKMLIEDLTKKQIDLVNFKLGGREYDSNKEHYNIFDEGVNRIKIPLEYHREGNSIEKEVRDYVNKQGYDIENYREGLASQEYFDNLGNKRKRIVKIGKLLQKSDKEVLKKFTYDPVRSGNISHEITLTRDKYDIAGMTSGRDWENQSCMKLPDEQGEGGVKHQHIKDDLKNHSLVAYLTKKGDDEIEAPLARVLIKKYTSKEKIKGKYHHIWRPDDKIYGQAPEGFLTSVKNYMAEKYPAKEGVGYSLAKGLYAQSETNIEPIQRGLIKENGVTKHFDKDGKLHDYVDENGINKPAILFDNGDYIHYKNGEVHRENDEPASNVGGVLEYRVNGELHRNSDNPATINEKKGEYGYYRYGLIHRISNKPSMIEPFYEAYYKYNQLHREGDEPALVEKKYDQSGNLVRSVIQYNKNGVVHRENDLPAYIATRKYYSNNKLINHKLAEVHSWKKNGKPYRDDPENNPHHTVGINGELIIQTFEHNNPNKPIRIEKTNDYISYLHNTHKKGYSDNNIMKNIMHYNDHVLTTESDHVFSPNKIRGITYQSDLHNFRGVTLNRSYFKFDVDGVEHLADAYSNKLNVYKMVDGIPHEHISTNVNGEMIDEEHPNIHQLVNHVKMAKFSKDENNRYDNLIRKLNANVNANENHDRINLLQDLAKPLK